MQNNPRWPPLPFNLDVAYQPYTTGWSADLVNRQLAPQTPPYRFPATGRGGVEARDGAVPAEPAAGVPSPAGPEALAAAFHALPPERQEMFLDLVGIVSPEVLEQIVTDALERVVASALAELSRLGQVLAEAQTELRRLRGAQRFLTQKVIRLVMERLRSRRPRSKAERDREIYRLRTEERLSFGQIAEQFKISYKAAQRAFSKEKLRRERGF
jgi:hypothetical protein